MKKIKDWKKFEDFKPIVEEFDYDYVKQCFIDLIESGKVFTDSRTEKGKQRAVTFYFWKAKKR